MECSVEILTGLFESLGLAELDKGWVETVYAAEFTDEQCDVELNFTRNTENTLEGCISILKKVVRKESTNKDFSYFSFEKGLNERDIDAKTIQSWIFCLLINSLKRTADARKKTVGLLAADLYFLLLHVGGETSQLYHAIIFDKAVLTMPDALKFDGSGEKSCDKDAEGDGHSNSNSSASVTARDMIKVSDKLFVTLKDFCIYLSKKSLRCNNLSLNRAMQALATVVSLLPCVTSIDFNKFEDSLLDTLSPIEVAFFGLYNSIDKKHGETNKLFQNLFRFLLPILIMKNACNSSASTIPQLHVRKSRLVSKFVRYLIGIHGDNIAHGVVLLIQNVIFECPDRTEFRNKMGSLVTEILQVLPLGYYSEFCKWLPNILHHEKSQYRGNAVVVLGRILRMPERRRGVNRVGMESLMQSRSEFRSNSETFTPAGPAYSTVGGGQPQRAYTDNTSAAIVRDSVTCSAGDIGTPVSNGFNDQEPQAMETNARFSTVIERSSAADASSNSPTFTEREMPTMDHNYFLKLFLDSLQDISSSVRSRVLIGIIDVMKEGVVTRSCFGNLNNPNSDDKFFMLLSNCIVDSKAMVRKSAVQSLETALCLEFIPLSKDSILLMEKCCKDPSLMVRKQAILSLTEVMNHHQKSSIVHSSWINGVLPAIADRESTVQTKVNEILERMVLDNIKSTQGDRVDLAWNLVKYLASENAWQFRPYLENIFGQWNKQMKLDLTILKNIIHEIENIDRKETCQGAWFLAKVFTLYKCNEESAHAIVTAWKKEFDKRHSLAFHSHAIVTIGQIVKYIASEDKKMIIKICSRQLKSFQCPIQLIPCLVETTCNLIQSMAEQGTDTSAMSWCRSVLKECDSFFCEVLFKHTDNHSLKLDSMINHLHVAGNVGKHFADIVPKRLLLSMQALVTGNDCLKQLSQSTMNSQLSQQMEPLSQLLKNIEFPQYVSTHAILSLGKIAIHNQNLAKKIVPALIHELDTCDSDIIRSNLVVILTDLCTKQTQLIDPHLQNIADCLGDHSDGVRRNALILLNSLLKKEYIKWRGSLIYKFLSLLCDKNQEIRELAFYCFTEQRLIENPGDFYFRCFVEAIFYFNGYEKHNVYNRFTKTERERSLFNLKGEQNYSSRFKIYEFMLQRMHDDHRFNTTSKLCKDVLDAYVDGIIPLTEKDILIDSLDILCCEDIKLKCMKTSSDDDVEMEEVQAVTAAKAKNVLHQKIISQVMKYNLVENIIPIIIALKNLMVAKQSPLLRNVMLYLKEVMKGYKTEVQDILAADKQLAKEIEFDLKRFERSFDTPVVPVINMEGTPTRPQQRDIDRVPMTPLSVARGRGIGIQAVLNTAGRNRKKPRNHTRITIPLNLETESLPVVISTPVRDGIGSTDVTFAISAEISAISMSS